MHSRRRTDETQRGTYDSRRGVTGAGEHSPGSSHPHQRGREVERIIQHPRDSGRVRTSLAERALDDRYTFVAILASSWILDDDPRNIDLLRPRGLRDRIRIADQHGFHDPVGRQPAHRTENSCIAGFRKDDPFRTFSGPIEDLL